MPHTKGPIIRINSKGKCQLFNCKLMNISVAFNGKSKLNFQFEKKLIHSEIDSQKKKNQK